MISVKEKYTQPEVVNFWQGLAGLQLAEQDMVSCYLPAAGHLLDLGCGAGRAVVALNKQGFTVTGLDLSLAMLQAGHNHSTSIQLTGGNLTGLPFNNNAFGGAFMFFGALQHISGQPNRRAVLAEIARVVEPDGRLLLGIDNLAPALICYIYWLKEKLLAQSVARKHRGSQKKEGPATADTTLWRRNTHPVIWHLRGLARTLCWRTWPGIMDRLKQIYPGQFEPGDLQVAQFSKPATPKRTYYHIYQALELIEDVSATGWQLLGYHAGTELSEQRTYPILIRQNDKQLFFAFQKR